MVQNKTLQNKILNIRQAKPTRLPKPMPSETSTGRQHPPSCRTTLDPILHCKIGKYFIDF
ncbi:hypothetical protein NEIFLAOT_01376 [Neisseria flavescens NRL30031/H210]|uniref:Uncharacterized protein n=1 Tax=Neisseria flavescens NRL30031/H210 TaxID=546264 RepID=C0EN43_NEIFL|nr:hypothetical protein NEIFLAOT_01376 [Neisseria flavescens NRL30031/H210]